MSFLTDDSCGAGQSAEASSCVETASARSMSLNSTALKLVEREPPDRKPRGRRQQEPVQQPERAGILHVGVPALLAEERVAAARGHELWRPSVRGMGILSDDLGGEAPEADGAHHVLAHADNHRRVLPPERVGIGGCDRIGLAEPAEAGVEGLVPGERAHRGLCQPHRPAPSVTGMKIVCAYDTGLGLYVDNAYTVRHICQPWRLRAW